MSDPLITASELATYLNDTNSINTARADLMIRQAQAKCEEFLSPLPDVAAPTVMDVAARGYVTTRQPRGGQMAAAGALFHESNGTQGGIWLTRSNKADLRRLADGGGAFSIDMLPPGYVGPGLLVADSVIANAPEPA